MTAIIKTEFQKIKRYHIMLIGVLGMACSPLLQLFSQAVIAEELKNPNYDFAALIKSSVWGSATIFMPAVFTLIGGYLINREYVDDTLKNVLIVPISFRKFLAGKLMAMGILAVILGVYCFAVTVAAGLFAGLPHLNAAVLAGGFLQMAGLAFWVYVAVLPIIAAGSVRPGRFMGGAVAAFILGYCCMFFKEGLLRDIYPFSAAMTLVGFDTADFAGTSQMGSVPLGAASLGLMLAVTAVLLLFAKAPENAGKARKKKGGKKTLRAAQRRRQM